jgi:hypothetical protein
VLPRRCGALCKFYKKEEILNLKSLLNIARIFTSINTRWLGAWEKYNLDTKF